MLGSCLSMRTKEKKESRAWTKLWWLTKKQKANGWKRLPHLPLAWKKAWEKRLLGPKWRVSKISKGNWIRKWQPWGRICLHRSSCGHRSHSQLEKALPRRAQGAHSQKDAACKGYHILLACNSLACKGFHPPDKRALAQGPRLQRSCCATATANPQNEKLCCKPPKQTGVM